MRSMVPSVTAWRVVLPALVIASGLFAAGAAAPGPLGRTATVGAESAAGYNPDQQECAMLDDINGFRKQHGKKPLVLLETLGAAAEHHSVDMAQKNYFSHNLKGGPSWSDNIRQHNYKGSPIGENIAAGYATAAPTFDQWENSAGHRQNMLDNRFKAIGIGRASNQSSTYDWYWTTTFGGEVTGRAARC